MTLNKFHPLGTDTIVHEDDVVDPAESYFLNWPAYATEETLMT